VRATGAVTAPASRGSSAWSVAAVAVAALLLVPIAGVLSSLATPRGEVWAHLWQTQLPGLIANTVLLLLGVGAGTLVLGTALAWLVASYRFPGRAAFESLLILPLAVPAYVIGFAALGLLDFSGPVQSALRQWLGPDVRLPDVRSGAGVVVVMTLVFYPYVYLLARAAFREQTAATVETARCLGLSRHRAFFAVTLPMARPSLVAGVALAMMEALADFGTVATFGYRTLTEAIYRVWLGMFDRAAAAQLASLLLLFAFGVLTLERALRGRARFVQTHRRGPGLPAAVLRGWRAAAATAACAGVVAVAFVLPVGQLLVWALADERAPLRFGRLLANTLSLAALAAAAVALLALVLAYAGRLHPSPSVRLSTRLAAMGYALPGSVIAVGVLIPVAVFDHALLTALEAALGRPLGLALTGSVVALLFAYVVRFVAVGFHTVEASLGKIPPSLDDAARSLGVGLTGTLRRVHLPLMRGGILTALILVFVETMKEMPATLLLRPFGVDTLAVAVWEATSESLWGQAAAPALAIVAAGLLPVFVAIRLGDLERERPEARANLRAILAP
jgi:iron(III) transport system permease protein